ncbi:MAG: radical SAM family heme chaperone HemW [Aestuariivirgaceae bacterium]
MRPDAPEAFGVYVHWPFCRAKCPYCDFNSHVRHAPVDSQAFAAALIRELSWFRGETGPRRVSSVFFGGGTPSLMPPAAVGTVIEAIARLWQVAPDAEITLEANPTSTESGNFAGYRAAGVTRASVGVQALDDGALRALGRQHSAAEALTAFRLAARLFPRVSFDLIYARPGQTVDAWRRELAQALGEQQGHMSLYQLTIEPGTAFAGLAATGALRIPDDDLAAALFETTQEMTAAAGLPAYEISNHARPGHECRHNLLYWRYGDYAGVGPGAHGRLTIDGSRRALSTERHPESWLRRVGQAGHGIVEDESLTGSEEASERLLMGLRLTEGVPAAALTAAGVDRGRLRALAADGLLDLTPDRASATAAGRQLLNAVIRELLRDAAPINSRPRSGLVAAQSPSGRRA